MDSHGGHRVVSYAGADWRSRLAARVGVTARVTRHERLFPLTGVRAGHRVLDLGCGAAGLAALEPGLDVTGVDLEPRPGYRGPVVVADARERLPFADGAFDLVYASSLIEHLPPTSWEPFASEVRRVARGYFIQTPAYSFPVEPHSLLPAAHWLPGRARRWLWRWGVGGDADATWMLRRGDLERLFGEPIYAERMFGLVKSWVCIRPVEERAPAPTLRR